MIRLFVTFLARLHFHVREARCLPGLTERVATTPPTPASWSSGARHIANIDPALIPFLRPAVCELASIWLHRAVDVDCVAHDMVTLQECCHYARARRGMWHER